MREHQRSGGAPRFAVAVHHEEAEHVEGGHIPTHKVRGVHRGAEELAHVCGGAHAVVAVVSQPALRLVAIHRLRHQLDVVVLHQVLRRKGGLVRVRVRVQPPVDHASGFAIHIAGGVHSSELEAVVVLILGEEVHGAHLADLAHMIRRHPLCDVAIQIAGLPHVHVHRADVGDGEKILHGEGNQEGDLWMCECHLRHTADELCGGGKNEAHTLVDETTHRVGRILLVDVRLWEPLDAYTAL
mmetsp:Transcript_25332/g.63533  ORF Transcript_25332/g.63533 Transcript_25332/m.63533 type:complete len:241 (-) Transcript_25332:357-1079(-)